MLLLLNKYPACVDKLGRPRNVGLFTCPRKTRSVAALAASGLPWGADNDCFNFWDEPAYRAMLARVAEHPRNCLFVSAPDVVGDGRATLESFGRWAAELAAAPFPLALVGQDGMESLDMDDALRAAGAFFVGGSTAWKKSRAAYDLVRRAKEFGLWVHYGRANSARRVRTAFDWGCDSFDGSSFNWFPSQKVPQAVSWLDRLEASPGVIGLFT
jgi:hypothetical protein